MTRAILHLHNTIFLSGAVQLTRAFTKIKNNKKKRFKSIDCFIVSLHSSCLLKVLLLDTITRATTYTIATASTSTTLHIQEVLPARTANGDGASTMGDNVVMMLNEMKPKKGVVCLLWISHAQWRHHLVAWRLEWHWKEQKKNRLSFKCSGPLFTTLLYTFLNSRTVAVV